MKVKKSVKPADEFSSFYKPVTVVNSYRDTYVHTLKWPITGYDDNGLMRTAPFNLCGSEWVLHIYPLGVDTNGEFLSLYLVSLSEENVRADYGFALKHPTDEEEDYTWYDPDSRVMFSGLDGGNNEWGSDEFISRSALEDSDYISNKQLKIEVILTVYGREDLNSSDSMAEAIGKAGAKEELIKLANEDLQEVVSRLPVRRNMKAQKKQEDTIVLRRGLK